MLSKMPPIPCTIPEIPPLVIGDVLAGCPRPSVPVGLPPAACPGGPSVRGPPRPKVIGADGVPEDGRDDGILGSPRVPVEAAPCESLTLRKNDAWDSPDLGVSLCPPGAVAPGALAPDVGAPPPGSRPETSGLENTRLSCRDASDLLRVALRGRLRFRS